jgi:hypothetical protein
VALGNGPTHDAEAEVSAKTRATFQADVVVRDGVVVVACPAYVGWVRRADAVLAHDLAQAHVGCGLEGKADAIAARAGACERGAVVADRAVCPDGVAAPPRGEDAGAGAVARILRGADGVLAEVDAGADAFLADVVHGLGAEIIAGREVWLRRGAAKASLKVARPRVVAL